MNDFSWDIIEGAIFDLDGTLVDSMQEWQNMGYTYIKLKNLEPEEKLNEKLYPLTIIQTAEYLNTAYGLNLDKETIIRECNGVMEAAYNNIIPLKPFVKEFLLLLKTKNIPMYVATATDRHLVEIALERHGIESFFQGIVTSTEAGSAKAESAAIFDIARKNLGTSLGKTIVFEDSYHAIKTAVAAGYPIAALYDLAAEKDLNEIKKISHWYSDSFESYVKSLSFS